MRPVVSEHLKAQGKTLTDWLRDEMRNLLAEAESTHGPRRKKK